MAVTTEEFIEKAMTKHGDKYDYSKVTYIKSTDKITIVCKRHGEFLQTPHKHIQGDGCSKCGVERIREKVTGTLQNFLDRATSKHGTTYDYSKVVYKAAKSKVIIICPTHGEFLQTPDDHTSGSGCIECSREKTAKRMTGSRKVSVGSFARRANSVHGHRYDYSKVAFNKTIDKVTIGCALHGDYILSVTKHLLGYECPKCAMSNRIQNGWSATAWKLAGEKSKNFNAYSVYVVRCSNDTEAFYKVGKTFKCIEDRIKKFKEVGYSVEITTVITGTAAEMSKKEKDMHRVNKSNKYIPSVKFCGSQECYSEVVND